MAEIRHGPTQYVIEVTTGDCHERTAGMLRDFVRALDEAGIPDDAEWRADLRYDARRYSLSLHHTVRVNEPPTDPEPTPQPGPETWAAAIAAEADRQLAAAFNPGLQLDLGKPVPQPRQLCEEAQAAYDEAVVDAAGYIDHNDADPVDDDGPSNG